MRRKLVWMGPLVVVLSAAAWSQTLVEYGALGSGTATGTAKAAGAVSKAADGLGKRLSGSRANTGSPSSAPLRGIQAKRPSSSPDPMLINRRALEQAAGKRGAALHVAGVPAGAVLYVDSRAVARTPADISLPAGKHLLELKSAAFLAWRQEVSVAAGEKLSFEPKLEENKQTQSDKRIVNLDF